MDNKDNKIKSAWTDISKVWGRVAGVIAAIGVIATFIVKVFDATPEIIYTVFAGLGIILLLISFYVDRQTEYTYKAMVELEQKARKDFNDIMLLAKQQTLDMKKDSNDKINALTENISEVLELAKDTRKDTLRIQLLMILKHQPDNIDTVLKLAETYFVKLHGDWYMTSEFTKWAQEHNVSVPNDIYRAIDENHK